MYITKHINMKIFWVFIKYDVTLRVRVMLKTWTMYTVSFELHYFRILHVDKLLNAFLKWLDVANTKGLLIFD